MDCPQAANTWRDMMESVSPFLLPLFEDLLAKEENYVLSTILEDEDNDNEDAILPTKYVPSTECTG